MDSFSKQKNRCPKASIEKMILMKLFRASTVLRGVKIKTPHNLSSPFIIIFLLTSSIPSQISLRSQGLQFFISPLPSEEQLHV